MRILYCRYLLNVHITPEECRHTHTRTAALYNNIFNISTFTISEAIHRLTLSYQGIVSPFYIFKLHIFCFVN